MQDMLGALLIPTERPPALNDIKRALLTFDSVHLLSPDDREFVDPGEFERMIRPMPPMLGGVFSIVGGPVLPIGKVTGYDDAFQRLHDELRPAIDAGFVLAREAPQVTTNTFTLFGTLPPPEAWASAQFLVPNLMQLITDKATLREAARGIGSAASFQETDLSTLVPDARILNEKLGDRSIPDLGENDQSIPAALAKALKGLAAARVGSVIKCLGMSELGGLFPLATEDSTRTILNIVHSRAAESLEKVIDPGSDDEAHLRRALRAERVVFQELGSDVALATMSVADVIKLRSGKNWEAASVARQRFLTAVSKLSREAESEADFERAIREAIADYTKASTESKHAIKTAGLAIAMPILAGLTAGGLAAKLIGLPSWELSLALSAFFTYAGDVGEQGLNAYRQFREAPKQMGKALVDIVPKPLRS